MGKRIFVAVLDWGLGHASRMVPVVECLTANGAEVTVASSGQALQYLKGRFPQMETHVLPAPEVRYGRWGAAASIAGMALSQKGWNAQQQRWTQNLVKAQPYDAIVSDNVYGVYSRHLPSVLISHQLQLPAPLFGKMINRELARWLDNFSALWVPDFEDGLAGKLAHNPFCQKPVVYLGTLSRLRRLDDVEKRYSCVALVSGPEPQRSHFEREALDFLTRMPGRKLLIRGVQRGGPPPHHLPEGVAVENFADGDTLSLHLQSADFVLSRAGFSSLSDFVQLGCRALIVPTPGQYEQEYLARRAYDKGWFAAAKQGEMKNWNPQLSGFLSLPPHGVSFLHDAVDRLLRL